MNNQDNLLKGLRKPLNMHDVEFRIKSVTKTGNAQILAYKNARVDMNRLDEVCGLGWQDKYEIIDGQLFCSVGILAGDQWLWRGDVGEAPASGREATKGRASDAFKRACVKWGIGRELYDYPKIWVKLKQNEFTVNGDRAKAKVDLSKWTWKIVFDGHEIKSLTAKDASGKQRYSSVRKADLGESAGKPASGQSGGSVGQATRIEKPWLNKLDESRQTTRQWNNVVAKFNIGKITSIDQVLAVYRLSKTTQEELEKLFTFTPKNVAS